MSPHFVQSCIVSLQATNELESHVESQQNHIKYNVDPGQNHHKCADV